MPGMVRLRPFRTREVFFPPTTAIGDTTVNSGVFQVLHDFDRRVIPEIRKRWYINKSEVKTHSDQNQNKLSHEQQ